MLNGLSSNSLADLNVVFLAILLDGFLFGVLTQQFYSYWIVGPGFQDSKGVKAFVIAQYCVVSLQCVMFCQLAWNIFIKGYCLTGDLYFKSYMWQGPVSSMCQCVLSLMANIFLANRIYTLTKSRLQTGSVIILSTTAFIFGLCALISPWAYKDMTFAYTHFTRVAGNATAILWHVLQATTEFLISAILIRGLLNTRSSFERSVKPVHYLTRRVIRLGLFATIWSLAGMVTWFLLPKYTIYALFDVTAGSVYTHMIFDTLLSRTRVHECIAEGDSVEISFYSQSQIRSRMSEGQQGMCQIDPGRVSVMAMLNLVLSTANASTLNRVTKGDTTDFKCSPVGQTGVHFEAPYTSP